MEVREPHRSYGNGVHAFTSTPKSNNQSKLKMPGTVDQNGSRPASYSPLGKRRQIQSKTNISSNSTVSSHQSTFTSTSRLYRAPQPALRIYQHIAPSSNQNPRIINGVEMVANDAGCSTRRRRKDSMNSSIASIARSERSKKDKMKCINKIYAHPPERSGSDRSISLDHIIGSNCQSSDDSSDSDDFVRMYRSENHLLTQSPKIDFRQTIPTSKGGSATRRSRVIDIDPNSTMISPITNRQLLSHRGTNPRTMTFLKSMESPTTHTNNYSKNSRRPKQDSSNNPGICYDYDNTEDSFRGGDDKITFHSEGLHVENGSANNSITKQPNGKSWFRSLKTIQRKGSIGKTPCRRGSFQCSSYLNDNTCHYDTRNRSWIRLIQLLVLAVCVVVVIDAKRKQRQHRIQLQKYDDERAHILEQMTWIDRAAKRVHNNYYQKMQANNADASDTVLSTIGRDLNDVNNSTSEKIRIERDTYRSDLEKLRINIQANARDKIQLQFGDKPMEVNIPLLSYVNGVASEDHLIIELWDDTPHAVLTLLQQISRGYWNEINLQRLETSVDPIPGALSVHNHRLDGIQLSPKPNGSIRIFPTLEFVETSRRCKAPGSVSLHQLESDDFQFTVLKVHVNEESHVLHNDDNDVCIGNVVSGLEALMSRLPLLPVIHKEDDDADKSNQSKDISEN